MDRGATIAIVASIETLLSVQAVDRLDPLKRRSPPDRELLAQGAANTVSGFLGGLPVTAVIVRSGANVAAGAPRADVGAGPRRRCCSWRCSSPGRCST